MKLGEPGQKIGELWGLPIIVSDEAMEGRIIVAALPTMQEIVAAGCSSLEDWVRTHPENFSLIENIDL
jgi:hypothetical protein